MKWWSADTRWRLRCVWRLLVIVGVTVVLMSLGLKGTQGGDKGFVATLLVLIGAIAVGYGISKVWPEPKR